MASTPRPMRAIHARRPATRGAPRASGASGTSRTRQRAFTLLEVLVAVAILGLALTIILSSQAGLFATAYRTQKLSFASNLARCKMNEVEVQLLQEGFQLADSTESGPCCDDERNETFSCEWKVELVELPTPSTFEDTENADVAGGLDLATDQLGSGSGMGPLDALNQIKNGAQGDDSVGGLASAFQETTGGMDGIASMAFSLVYPTFKPMLEASIRKVTVSVQWKEGQRDKQLDVVQFITRPQLPPPELTVDPDDPDAAGTGTPAVPTALTPGALGGQR